MVTALSTVCRVRQADCDKQFLREDILGNVLLRVYSGTRHALPNCSLSSQQCARYALRTNTEHLSITFCGQRRTPRLGTRCDHPCVQSLRENNLGPKSVELWHITYTHTQCSKVPHTLQFIVSCSYIVGKWLYILLLTPYSLNQPDKVRGLLHEAFIERRMPSTPQDDVSVLSP